MTRRDSLLDAARKAVGELEPAPALQRQRQGALLIDIRDDDERASGTPAGALGLSRGFLELRIEQHAADTAQPLMLLCGGGQRSLLAARALQEMGYTDVCSVAGGFSRWKAEGLPVDLPRNADADYRERYSRHLLLPEVGVAGQQRLDAARVLVVGAGGLGSPVALYLAAAGIGRIGLVDDDRVERSNLQRQVLHADARVGMPKVQSARSALLGLNPRIDVETFDCRLDSANVEQVLSGFDVVVDGADNFPTRYLLSDACIALRVPLVYGAVFRFEGQVSVFDAGRHRGEAPCYRCLFPEPPPPELAPNCAEAGVLGVLPGLVGMIQATEVVKLILGLGETLAGRLLQVDALRMRFRETRLPADPACRVCAIGADFPGYIDYAQFCAAAGS